MGGVELSSINFAVTKNILLFQNLFIVGVDFLANNTIEICPKDRKLIKHCSALGFIEFYFDGGCEVTTKSLQRFPCYSDEDVVIDEGKSRNLIVNWANITANVDECCIFLMMM